MKHDAILSRRAQARRSFAELSRKFLDNPNDERLTHLFDTASLYLKLTNDLKNWKRGQ